MAARKKRKKPARADETTKRKKRSPSGGGARKKAAARKKAVRRKVARKKAASGTRKAVRKAPARAARKTRRKAARKTSRKAADEPIVDELIILAVRGMTLFPGVVLPIVVGRERSVRAVQAAVQGGQPIGLLVQRDPAVEVPAPEELYQIGTVADIVRYLTAPDGGHHAVARGRARFKVLEFTATEPHLTARVERIEQPVEDDPELSPEEEARFHTLKQLAAQALSLMPEGHEDLASGLQNITAPGLLCDVLATFMDLPVEEKQEILETLDVEARIAGLTERLQRTIEILQLSQQISQKTQGTLEKAQRDYFLREQLRTIQKELGEGGSQEIEELRAAIEEAGMPEEVLKEASKELSRLERTPEASMEHGTIRTYLDWLIELPWSKATEDLLDLKHAREVLDADHYGLQKVKRRILEFLAVRKLKPEGKGPILCLVGPPGVGKTSLGQSVARAMGRKFVRASLGGVHDEAEIRGHRRTYVGSMPGKIIQEIRKVGTNNPVFMLDEMDKLGASFQGDPSAALLEVLDPEQNNSFQDHYLGVPFDLSPVLFMGTANVLSSVPGPLQDRCEVIELPGYTEEEKLEIARRYLVGRRLDENGLTVEQCALTDDALRSIVRGYTREAGCRNLEREIGSVIRHVATLVAEGTLEKRVVDASDLHEILGPVRFEDELALRTGLPGVATGLSWTPVGGQILFVEATGMPGKGNMTLTGQLGDVMKESVQAAMTLVKAAAADLGIDPELFPKRDIHVHVPAGGIPKDGPSAGVTMYTALVSMLTGIRVRSEVAMTGEISLRGLVLPVGGVKDKVLAAHHAGIGTVLLPARNMKDLEDVPPSARDQLRFVPLERVDQVLGEALERPPTAEPGAGGPSEATPGVDEMAAR